MFSVVILVFVLLLNIDEINSYALTNLPCTTPNGTQGTCTQSKNCPSIDKLIANSEMSIDFVTKSICGYDNNKSKLFCCDIREVLLDKPVNKEAVASQKFISAENQQNNVPASTEKIGTFKQAAAFSELTQEDLSHRSYCQTPNGDGARCVSIYTCPKLVSIPRNRRTAAEIRYLRESKCGIDNGNFLVCCGADVDFRKPQETWNYQYNKLIPSNICGLEMNNPSEFNNNKTFSLDNRIFGGNNSEIDEFPWVALIEYAKRPGQSQTSICGGSLVSSRYVLTAAHCILGPQASTIAGVRLGEWNLFSNQANDAVHIGVESLHPHPGYKLESPDKYHDIGLIKLNKQVQFTNRIMPICLPSPTDHLLPGERATISGFGLKNYNEETLIKQKVDVPIIPISQCSMMFGKSARFSQLTNYKLGNGQFCAGGEFGKDACTGDSGAPLMKRSNATSTEPARWHLHGLVSFGLGCGAIDHYGVYTKVSNYVAWIHQTIVP